MKKILPLIICFIFENLIAYSRLPLKLCCINKHILCVFIYKKKKQEINMCEEFSGY